VLCEPIPILQVSLRATVPCLAVVLLSLPPTLLEEIVFLVLHYCIVLAYLFFPTPKLGYLALSLPELVEGELQLYWRSGAVVLTRLLVLPFHLSRVQYKLGGYIVVLATLLKVHP
jgi:hypothetical protein